MNSRVEALVVGLGENLSHQEKFDSAKLHVESCLSDAELELSTPLEACSNSDDILARKEEHMVCVQVEILAICYIRWFHD